MPQIDSKAFYKLSYGLYLLSTKWQGKDNACIVDAVMKENIRVVVVKIDYVE